MSVSEATPTRKIVVYVATSADGFLARPDGDVGWLDRPEPPGGYGMKAFYKTVDTVLLGRKTWEMGRKLGQPLFPGMKNYVFSRRARPPRAPGIELVKGDVGQFSRRLRGTTGKNIWLVGGADLIGAFLDAGEIDELVVHVIPVLIGRGIPLIAPRHREVPLRLIGSRKYSDGVVRLHYAVPRAKPRRTRGRR
jgi:dihydrofolate reductase